MKDNTMGIKFISPFSRILCPYCGNSFHLCETIYRNVTDENDLRPDLRVNKAFPKFVNAEEKVECPEEKPNFPLVYRALAKIPFFRRCFVVKTSGREFGKDRKQYWGCCPRCGLRMPRQWCDGKLANKTIAVIGVKWSGKSCFLMALIPELEMLTNTERFAFVPLETLQTNPDIGRKLSVTTSDFLYQIRYGQYADLHRPLPYTYSATVDQQVRIPLIYRIMKGGKSVDLCLYDTAGEDTGNSTQFNNIYRHVSCASGIVIIVDPFSYSALRNVVDNEYQAEDRIDPIGVLYRSYLHNGRLKRDAVSVPCAITLSKFDRFDRINENDDLWGSFQEIYRRLVGRAAPGVLPKKDREELHRELQNLFEKAKVPLGSGPLNELFLQYRLFAMSALGGDYPDNANNQNNGGIQGNFVKFGVAEPIVWLLEKFGVL